MAIEQEVKDLQSDVSKLETQMKALEAKLTIVVRDIKSAASALDQSL